jgi:hypothetical protein
MSSDLKTEIVSVNKLLSISNLAIPTYQRPYKWTGKNIQQLLQDIDVHQHRSAYRLGTVVFHHEDDIHHEDDKGTGILNIVDGQQRTLTLLLTVKVIIDTRLEKLDRKDIKDQLIKLNANVSSFMARQAFGSDISKRNLHQNFLELTRLVSRNEFTEAHIDFLLNKCELVCFTLHDVSEAFQFFDSQNARGKDLEPHDLLKAFHLREFSEHDQLLKEKTVSAWEEMEAEALKALFANYLYRIRQWARGHSARYFTRNEVDLFKGVNLEKVGHFPYVEQLRMTHHFVDDYNAQYQRKIDGQKMDFPFHLDQMIINGRRFFEMATHYQKTISEIVKSEHGSVVQFHGEILNDQSRKILKVINHYESRHRTGDRYVRGMFDCLVIYYLDKFGSADVSRAIEKIFIWAYSLRIKQQVVQLATMDNYVQENNWFRQLKEATVPSDFLSLSFKNLEQNQVKATKVDALTSLFKEMNYYE